MVKKFSTPCTSGYQGMKNMVNTFSKQGSALSPSLFEHSYPFKIERLILVPQVLIYCLFDTLIVSIQCTTKMGFQFWEQIEVRRSHIKRIWGMRSFQIHIQLVMSTCEVWAGALSSKSRTLRVSFPRLFFAISWCSRLNLPA